MGISERREREKFERRGAIINCAKELILAQGVDRVSIEDIARKAELSKATVYLYFSNKEMLFNEICEEAARGFWEHLEPFLGTGVTGIAAVRCFWRGYVELFGRSGDMFIVFQVRNFLNPGQPFVTMGDKNKSQHIDAILQAIKNLIDQCKDEGAFDPNLDSVLATNLLLLMFSSCIDNAIRMSPEIRKSPIITEEMTKTFQIIIRGFAREGVKHSSLDITSS